MSAVVGSDWLAELEARWLPGDPRPPSQGKRGWLRLRYHLVSRLKPAFIAEIGVRAGYSAYAMLSAAPTARYLGIDIRTDTHGGVVGADLHAAKLLAHFPAVEFLHADSRMMDRLPPGIDLLHIDGDHSEAGCLSDLALADRSGVRWALVDDTSYIPDVRRAVHSWMDSHPCPVKWLDDPHRGAALLHLEAHRG